MENMAYSETGLGVGGMSAVQHVLPAPSLPVHGRHSTPPNERPEEEIYVSGQQSET